MDTLKTGTSRRHFTAKRRQRLLAKFHKSRLTQNEFAAQHNIGLSSLSRWLIYTLLGSCRRHGINPFDFLKDLFTRLPAAKITQIKEFTPVAWAKTKSGASLPAQTLPNLAVNLTKNTFPPPFNCGFMGCQKLRT